MHFRCKDGSFDIPTFIHVVNIIITAQELLVDNSSYPTKEICENSHTYRTLGLGYANLGALLMSWGMPYDSDAARGFAGAVTSLMTSSAYCMSQGLARVLGTFEGYERNEKSMTDVMLMHQRSSMDNRDFCEDKGLRHAQTVADTATSVWTGNLQRSHDGDGYRNAQVTVLAPTGTIGFMMDCDTTGVEPDIALVKYKALAGGGMMKLVNTTVRGALETLEYGEGDIAQIVEYIDENDTIEGCKTLKEEHLPVFDCAFKPMNGERSIHYMAHIKMMAAVQRFLSGAISKTVNMPENATPKQIAEVYMEGWKRGLKAVAIYRENSKRIQPLSVDKDKGEGHEQKINLELDLDVQIPEPAVVDVISKALEDASSYPEVAQALADHTSVIIKQVQAEQRERLPDTRSAINHKFEVQGHEGYLNIGLYDDGRPGEIFITMNKEGSTVRGLMDGIGVALSIGFQYGVPLEVLADKFEHTRFEPAGFTKNKDIPMAKSLLDYIFRWLTMTFPEGRYVGYKQAEVVGLAFGKQAEVVGLAFGNLEGIQHAEIQLGDGTPVEINDGLVTTTQDFSQVQPEEPEVHHGPAEFRNQDDAPVCANCGSITVRNGSCYRCHNCGSSLGCS